MNEDFWFIEELLPLFSDARMAAADGRETIRRHTRLCSHSFLKSLRAASHCPYAGARDIVTRSQLVAATLNALTAYRTYRTAFYKMQYETYSYIADVLLYKKMTPGKLHVKAKIRMNHFDTYCKGTQRIVKAVIEEPVRFAKAA